MESEEHRLSASTLRTRRSHSAFCTDSAWKQNQGHPYGSGSLRAEHGSGGLQKYAKNRLLSLESVFRRSPVWSFWMLERLIKNDLFFLERGRKQARQSTSDRDRIDQQSQANSQQSVSRPSQPSISDDGPAATGSSTSPDNYAVLFGFSPLCLSCALAA